MTKPLGARLVSTVDETLIAVEVVGVEDEVIGSAVDPRNILRTIQIAAQKAGMAGIDEHRLRHSAAVAWLERVSISRPWLTYWGTPLSLSLETSMDTPQTMQRGRRLRG